MLRTSFRPFEESSMRSLIPTLAALSLPLAALPAASVDAFLDLRLGVSTTAGLADFEADGYDGEWDQPLIVQGTVMTSSGLGLSGGFVYGATIAYQTKDGDVDGIDIDYTSTDLRAHLGYGVAILPALHVEALATVGAAFAEVEAAADSVSADDDNIDFQYGLDANLLYTMESDLQLGVGLGYRITDGEYDLGNEIDFEQDEFLVTAFIGYRL